MNDTKAGSRHNAADRNDMQTLHDISVRQGATCGEDEEPKSITPETPIFIGASVKALDDSGKVGGYLVSFSSADNPDLTGDFFTKETDFGTPSHLPLMYQHGFDPKIGRKRIGITEITSDDVGLWAESQLELRDEYERMIFELAKNGKLGYSSGAAGHTVERVHDGKAAWIKQWYIAEASLTPTPAEPRNTVTPLKSIFEKQETVTQEAQVKREVVAKPEIVVSKQGVNKMEIEENVLQDLLEKAAQAGATKAISVTEPVKTSPTVVVVEDEADRPFKTLAEQAQAVKDFTISFGRKVDPRLNRLINSSKAIQGASESVPSDGGILLEPTLVPQVLKPVHEEGAFSADVSRLPVSSNSNSGWINGVDETSRATGSRWGGLRGYRLAEGDAVTKSKPAFRRIQWELKKFGVLVYDTNELLKDAAQFAAVVEQGAREELSFMLNDDIMNGLGVSGPQGVMNSGALITVTRDTGAAILGTDISAMWARMLPRSKANAKWYVNAECGPQLDKLFAVGSTAVLFPYAGYTTSGVRTLYGRPVVETEFSAALNTTGDILLADMSQYLLWEKGGIESATSMHVEFLTDQEVIRFIYRVDGQTAHASAITPYKGTATQSPFVVLSSAT